MKPRCGRIMHPYEGVWGALLDEVVCGRPEGHTSRCRSRQAVQKARERAREKWPEYRTRRPSRSKKVRDDQVRDQLVAAVESAAQQVREREMATRAVNW